MGFSRPSACFWRSFFRQLTAIFGEGAGVGSWIRENPWPIARPKSEAGDVGYGVGHRQKVRLPMQTKPSGSSTRSRLAQPAKA